MFWILRKTITPKENYLRFQPDFSEDDTYKEFKDTPLDLDVKDVDLLEKLREATNVYYENNKDKILRLIED